MNPYPIPLHSNILLKRGKIKQPSTKTYYEAYHNGPNKTPPEGQEINRQP